MGFLEDYFINPILQGTGYNLINTAVYAIILIFSLFLVVKLLMRLGIRPSKKFWYDLLPFVILGGVVRALQDMRFFTGLGSLQYIFVTPFIYLLIFAIVLITLLISKYWKDVTRITGYALLLIFLLVSFAKAIEWTGFGIIIGLTLVSFGLTFFLVRYLKPELVSGLNFFPVLAHVLDGCATVTAVSIVGGFQEQHVVPNLLFSFLPLWTFIPIKILISLLAVYIIEKETKLEWNWLLLFTIFVLGMGPGVRDSFTVLLGSNL